jgi:hypothetical protein
MLKVKTYKKACPICKGDVKGNAQLKYFCRKCNMLFNRDQLRAESKYIQEVVDMAFAKRVKALKQEQASKPKPIGKMKDQDLKDKFIVSLKSTKYHAINCPFARKIKRDNMFYFDTKDQARSKGYKPCVCMKK